MDARKREAKRKKRDVGETEERQRRDLGEREKGGEGLAPLLSSHTRSRSSDDRPRLLAPTLPSSATVRPLPPTSLSPMPLARPLGERSRSSPPRPRPACRRRRRRRALPSPFGTGAISSNLVRSSTSSASALPRVTSPRHLRTFPHRLVVLSLFFFLFHRRGRPFFPLFPPRSYATFVRERSCPRSNVASPSFFNLIGNRAGDR